MLKLNKKNSYVKPISKLNQNLPEGFQYIYFRLLPINHKIKVIENKLEFISTRTFKDFCSNFSFSFDEHTLSREKNALLRYLKQIKSEKMNKKKAQDRNPNKQKIYSINRNEIINQLSIQRNLFNVNLKSEYSRVFDKAINIFHSVYNTKSLSKKRTEKLKIKFNLIKTREEDLEQLNNERKDLELTLRKLKGDIVNKKDLINRIKILEDFIVSYASMVYQSLIDSLNRQIDTINKQFDHFSFNVVDEINKTLEALNKKSIFSLKEMYFDDNFNLILKRELSTPKYIVFIEDYAPIYYSPFTTNNERYDNFNGRKVIIENPIKRFYFDDLTDKQKYILISILKNFLVNC